MQIEDSILVLKGEALPHQLQEELSNLRPEKGLDAYATVDFYMHIFHTGHVMVEPFTPLQPEESFYEWSEF